MNIVFLGTPSFGATVLRFLLGSEHNIFLVVSQPDREKDRKGNIVKTPVSKLAFEENLNLLQCEKIAQEEIESIKKMKPDIMITAAFGQILKQDFLDIAPVYNVHASLLPNYRGSSPVQAAILNGDKKTGVTIMKTELGLDCGDILLQKELQIKNDETAGELQNRLAALGGEAIVEALKKISKGTERHIKQNEKKATYTKKIKKEDGIINWESSAVMLERKARAYSPWPGLQTVLKGEKIKLLSVEVGTMSGIVSKSGEGEKVACGEIISISNNKITVLCAKGAIDILQLQASGKRPTSAYDFLQGRKISVGDRFI